MHNKICVLAALSFLAACGGGGGGSSITPPTPTYTIGGLVSGLAGTGLVLQNNLGNDLAVAANGAVAFSTAINSGSVYSVSVRTQPATPTQTCTVTNGSGTVSANISNVTITCVTNSYAVGGTVTGLTGTGLVLQNNLGNDLAVAANSNITFSTAITSGSAYSVTVKTQPATPAQTCSVASGSGTVTNAAITNAAISCKNLVGKFLYVLNSSDSTISVYAINPSNGALTPVSGSPYSAGANFRAVTSDPAGKFLYINNLVSGGQTLSGYTINATTGALTPIVGSPYSISASTAGGGIFFHPNGNFLYFSDSGNGQWYGYAINAATGALTPVPGSPYFVGAVTRNGVFNSTGQFVYAPFGNGTTSPSTVAVYSVNITTGALTLANSVLLGATSPLSARIHSSGNFLYVTHSSGLTGFSINPATGALSPIAGSSYALGVSPGLPTFDLSGQFMYVLNLGFSSIGPGSVSAFSINQTSGALTSIAGSPYSQTGLKSGMSLYPNGKFLTLTTLGLASSSAPPTPAINGSVSIYGINPTTGVLTEAIGSPFATAGTSPRGPVIDASGSFAYMTDSVANTLTAFAINEATGAITVVGIYPTGTTPGFPRIVGLQ